MRHLIAVARFKTEHFLGNDEHYPVIVLSILDFELGFIAGHIINSLA